MPFLENNKKYIAFYLENRNLYLTFVKQKRRYRLPFQIHKTMNTQLSTTDYTAIANSILANCPDESKTFELEYEAKDYTIFIDVDYDVEYRDVVGGSYEGYDFEVLSEVSSERFDIVGYDTFDSEGDPIETDFNEGILLNLLNN